jgi:hypothetical protein
MRAGPRPGTCHRPALLNGPGLVQLPGLDCGGGPAQLIQFCNIPNFSNNKGCSNLGKHKINASLPQKIGKLCMVVDKWKRNNFPFGNEFKFPAEFEIKIQ